MNNFDFSVNNTPAISTSLPMLAAWEIHRVKLTKAEIAEITSKNDPSAKYKLIRLRFENPDGYYEHSIFYPADGDNERPVRTNSNGKEYQSPSRFEITKGTISQIAAVLNNSGWEQMQKLSAKFKTFDDLARVFCKILEPVIEAGTETNLKLAGYIKKTDGSVVVTLPQFLGVNGQTGEVYVSTNFIGERLFWDAYDEKRRAQFKNAKPTNMPDLNTDLGMLNLAGSVAGTINDVSSTVEVENVADEGEMPFDLNQLISD